MRIKPLGRTLADVVDDDGATVGWVHRVSGKGWAAYRFTKTTPPRRSVFLGHHGSRKAAAEKVVAQDRT